MSYIVNLSLGVQTSSSGFISSKKGFRNLYIDAFIVLRSYIRPTELEPLGIKLKSFCLLWPLQNLRQHHHYSLGWLSRFL